MKEESNSKDLSPAQDRLVDALLAEHSRLGKGGDEDLIANIMLNTVDAPTDISQFTPAEKESFGFSEWAKIAAVVAVISTLGALALSHLGSGEKLAKVDERQEETFHLVVNYVDPDNESETESRVDRKVLVTAQPGSNRLLPVNSTLTGSIAPFEISEVDLAPPATEFGQSIDSFPSVLPGSSSFRLASNDSTATGGKVIYSGEVVLNHPDFVLKADSLVMDKSAGEVPVLKALNAVLSHRQGLYDAEADAISFDPSNGELVAKGVHRLASRGIDQTMINQAAVVVFEGDEFFIQEGFARPF